MQNTQRREGDFIPTDAVPTNVIPTEIQIDRHVITLYIHIHQGATVSCVMFGFIRVKVSIFQTFMWHFCTGQVSTQYM